MKREKLVQTLERETGLNPPAARDCVDRLVHGVLSALRRGEAVELPGLGSLPELAGVTRRTSDPQPAAKRGEQARGRSRR
jgi:nucleoid DNA-binding protein